MATNRHPHIQLIIGPMMSGKTSAMCQVVKRYIIAKHRCLIVKNTSDTRFGGADNVINHAGHVYKGMPVITVAHLHDVDVGDAQVIGIDEGQFFDDIYSATQQWVRAGIIVVIAYLDADATGAPFGDLGRMVAGAESVTKLSAICMTCGADASFSKAHMQLSRGEKHIGGATDYSAACRTCFDTK